ncbi:hypothetical protein [Pseudonocardia phyllosphaerae]|uniref:hypothetical protein n=1 Tax=Pseudonocardia phyllosphaerae TaxID=3390502 RepID=UPI00397842F7
MTPRPGCCGTHAGIPDDLRATAISALERLRDGLEPLQGTGSGSAPTAGSATGSAAGAASGSANGTANGSATGPGTGSADGPGTGPANGAGTGSAAGEPAGPPPGSAGACTACPVCALIAVLRGEHSEFAARLAQQVGGLLSLLIAVLEETGEHQPRPEPDARGRTRPGTGTNGARPRGRTVQRIPVHRP